MPSTAPSAKLQRDIDVVLSLAPPLPDAASDPALILLSGVPDSGKTTLARRMRDLAPVAVITSDQVRAALFPSPRHTRSENGRVFRAIRPAAGELLRRRINTVIDATNLIEAERAILYREAAAAGCRLIVVRVTASAGLIRERLDARSAVDPYAADVEVYERMRDREQPIARPHYVVDMSYNADSAIEALVREISDR